MTPQRKDTNKNGRVARLVKIIGLLQVGKGHNADSLAKACKVSRRTIFRDLDVLRQAEVPLRFHEQEKRYSIPNTYYLPPTSFTPEEALAMIVLCQELGAGGQMPFLSAAATAALKLEGSLPTAMKECLREQSSAMSIELAAHNPLAGQSDHYNQLLLAIAQRRCVDMEYDSYSERVVDRFKFCPYQLHFARRSWYVIGRSAKHREVRTFNVGRIRNLEMREDQFDIPRSFSIDRHLGNAWHLVKEDAEYKIVIHFAKLVARNVDDVKWHKTQKTRKLPDGTLEFRVTVAGLNEISWWILGYGDEAKVIEPPELQQLVRDRAARTAKQYGTS